jgi:hypothetical protein
MGDFNPMIVSGAWSRLKVIRFTSIACIAGSALQGTGFSVIPENQAKLDNCLIRVFE